MTIKIIGPGKLKEKYLKDAVKEYEKRLQRYIKLQIIEVADEKTPDSPSLPLEEKIKAQEGERILRHIQEGQYVIALDSKGAMVDSVGFAKCIEERMISGQSQIAFVIGGSLGLSKQIIQRANLVISFSKLTFPHQLMRVILLEQIYRSMRIINHEPYHK